MGVSGLWDVLQHSAESRSMLKLCVEEGFEKSSQHRRGYRVGIDVSLWLQHVSHRPAVGENPALETFFFKLGNLAQLPIIPLFVFDGRNRPLIKRKSKKGKSGSHPLALDAKRCIEAFGFSWKEAHGEAEAELAQMNRQGYLDAVISDDVDCLIFGARTILRNTSLNLTGNKSSPATDQNGKATQSHAMVYTADAVTAQCGLSQGGLLLIALLSGGDYDEGLPGFGIGISAGIAKCGFGDELLNAFKDQDRSDIHQFYPQWRRRMEVELHTNARGFLPHRCASLRIPNDFPSRRVVEYYVNPGLNKSAWGNADRLPLSITKLAQMCEDKFDWGNRERIIQRFRDNIWEPALVVLLRKAAIEADNKELQKWAATGRTDRTIRGPLRPSATEAVGTNGFIQRFLNSTVANSAKNYDAAFVNPGSPARATQPTVHSTHPIMQKIVGLRKHPSNDYLAEYRVEICPIQLVELACIGIKGKRAPLPNARERKGGYPDPKSTLRVWLPATMIQQVHPDLVEAYEQAEAIKKVKGKKGKAKVSDIPDIVIQPEASSSTPRRANSEAPTRVPPVQDTHDNGVFEQYDPDIPIELHDPFPLQHPLAHMDRGFIYTFPNPDLDIEFNDETDPEPMPTSSQSTSALVPPMHAASVPVFPSVGSQSLFLPDPDDEGEDDPLNDIWDQILDRPTLKRKKVGDARKKRSNVGGKRRRVSS